MAGIASPLLALPAITASFGGSAWTSVAVGQSIGGALAVVAELGWGLTGPQKVARLGNGQRRKFLAVSLLTKSIMFVPLAVIAGLAGHFLVTDFRLETTFVAIATLLAALNSVWYFVGIGSVSRILVTDAIPKIICVTASAVAIFSGASFWVYPLVGLMLPSIYTIVTVIRLENVRMHHFRGMTWRRILLVIRSQSLAMSGRALSALYISLPVTLVSIAAPSSVNIFAAVERLQRMYLQIMTAVPNAMQNWVGGEVNPMNRRNKSVKAVYFNAVFGIVAAGLFCVTAPTASDLIFSGTATISYDLSLLSGFLILTVCISRATGSLTLVAAGRIGVITYSALAGAVIGIPGILIGSSLLGVHGALLAELAAELTVLLVQIFFIRSLFRPPR